MKLQGPQRYLANFDSDPLEAVDDDEQRLSLSAVALTIRGHYYGLTTKDQ
jgi:hypothetical protein